MRPFFLSSYLETISISVKKFLISILLDASKLWMESNRIKYLNDL
jgi:hypothetical protein